MIKIHRTAASYGIKFNATGLHHMEENFCNILEVYDTNNFCGKNNFY